jgi:hypothetical protein
MNIYAGSVMSEKLLREAIRAFLREDTKLNPAEKGEDVNISVEDERIPEVEDALADMVKSSYAPLGGWSEIETPAGLKGRFTHFYIADVDEDPDPDAGIYYTDRSGSKKASAVVTDGTPAGKSKLQDLMMKFFSKPGSWIEVSGAPANILIKKLGLPTVEDEGEVRALLSRLPQEDITWEGTHPDPKISYGSGWYTRTIGGHRETKIIVGNP